MCFVVVGISEASKELIIENVHFEFPTLIRVPEYLPFRFTGYRGEESVHFRVRVVPREGNVNLLFRIPQPKTKPEVLSDFVERLAVRLSNAHHSAIIVRKLVFMAGCL